MHIKRPLIFRDEFFSKDIFNPGVRPLDPAGDNKLRITQTPQIYIIFIPREQWDKEGLSISLGPPLYYYTPRIPESGKKSRILQVQLRKTLIAKKMSEQ